jgi:N-ethylmaleimide reductase
VIGVWGADRVGLHLSPVSAFNDMHDSNPGALFTYVACELNRFGLAYLHVVECDGANPKTADSALTASARKLRAAYKGTYIANGGFSLEPDRAEAAIASGGADLISFGRLFISNPDLPRRLAANAPTSTWRSSTFYGGDERGYTDYPFLDQDT